MLRASAHCFYALARRKDMFKWARRSELSTVVHYLHGRRSPFGNHARVAVTSKAASVPEPEVVPAQTKSTVFVDDLIDVVERVLPQPASEDKPLLPAAPKDAAPRLGDDVLDAALAEPFENPFVSGWDAPKPHPDVDIGESVCGSDNEDVADLPLPAAEEDMDWREAVRCEALVDELVEQRESGIYTTYAGGLGAVAAYAAAQEKAQREERAVRISKWNARRYSRVLRPASSLATCCRPRNKSADVAGTDGVLTGEAPPPPPPKRHCVRAPSCPSLWQRVAGKCRSAKHGHPSKPAGAQRLHDEPNNKALSWVLACP